MILLIAYFNALKNRPDKLDYYFFNHLQKKSKYNITFCEPIEEEINKFVKNNSIIIVFSCQPDLKKYKNKKIYWLYDLCCICNYGCNGKNLNCGFNNQYQYIKEQNFDKIWYKYKTYITKRLSIEEPNKYFKFPHTIFNPDIHKDYRLEKKYDILFYGAINSKSYPFRNRLFNLLNKNQEKFNVKFLPYTKKHPEKMTTWIELYKLINQSWITISTCATIEALLAKYFEIGLCGSVICGNYPSQEDETFLKEHMVLLDRNMSDEEIINSIQNALKNKNKLLEYSKKTQEYISKNYMYENGLQLFENLINSLNN